MNKSAISKWVMILTLSLGALGWASMSMAQHPVKPAVQAGQPVKDRYIVEFKPQVAQPAVEAQSLINGRGGKIHYVYQYAVKGFAATIPANALEGIQNNPNVESVERDMTATISQITSPQNNATWGLDRIDQIDRPLDTVYTFNRTGQGVSAFIIDTGIRADHVEFEGRVLSGYTVISDGNGTNDCYGHGTAVAGTLGSGAWGVAKGVSLIPVRVLDCTGSGTVSGVIAGVDWVASTITRPALANMSLSGGASRTLDRAVAGAVGKGVVVVVAAGNSNADACLESPARESSAITVGASTSNDSRASYSNYGSCLDIFAPGDSITSAWNTSSTASAVLSGTSLASPHVAGVVALVLEGNPKATPSAVTEAVRSSASLNKLSSIGTGSPNQLLYGYVSDPVQPVVASVAVKSMTSSTIKLRNGWKASATVGVRDVSTGANVANAQVFASFTSGQNYSCVTSSTGACTMSTGLLSAKTSSTTVSVTNITGTNMLYDVSQNAVTQIMISKP